MAASAANRRGIIAIVVASATFTCNDAIIKLVAQKYPLGEVLFIRSLMTVALTGVLLVLLGHTSALIPSLRKDVLSRSTLDGLAAVFFTSALIHMPLASLSTVILISPLIITALSVLFFHEEVGWRRWSAVSVGFLGVLFVVKPTPSAFDAWALLGLLCAFTSATRDLITRQLDPAIPPMVISFFASIAVTLAGLALGVTERWRPMALEDVGFLAISSGFFAVAIFLVVIAFRGSDTSVVAPFRYSALIWAGLIGFLVFAEIPDRWSILGAALIVASGVYALHRERVRQRGLISRIPPG